MSLKPYIHALKQSFFKLVSFVLISSSLSTFAQGEQNNNIEVSTDTCTLETKSTFDSGWYLWKPYQYFASKKGSQDLVGMDIELTELIAKNVGISLNYNQIAWRDHQDALKDGQKDIAAGASKSLERENYAYFSIPYRFEENSLFTKKNSNKTLDNGKIHQILGQIRLKNYKLGVVDGFLYADKMINDFISDPINKDIIVKSSTDEESLKKLLKGEIDGFLADRLVGADAILSARAGNNILELQLGITTPIHFMFSKKTVTLEQVQKFNDSIKAVQSSKEYKDIVKTYFYPILLMQTINADWFYIVGIIGTIAFAISGIAIAVKENATFFGTILFAMLPSIGGGILRDILLEKGEINIFLTPSYVYAVIITVVLGFALVKLQQYYNNFAQGYFIRKFWDNLLIVTDALGQATFIVTGVSITIVAKVDPVQLWGPFFAFLTANGGGILRDLLKKDKEVTCLTGELNAEISILWGFIFATFLKFNAYNPDPSLIRNMVIISIIGAFSTRLLTHYLKIQNLKFHNN